MKGIRIIFLAWWTSGFCCYGQVVLDNTMHHIRNGEVREWSEFPLEAKEQKFLFEFSSTTNSSSQTLILQQYDVKQNWRVLLNDRDIGALIADEKQIKTYLTIPADALRDGQNTLRIECKGTTSDDIKVGNIQIDARPIDAVLSETSVELNVVDIDSNVPLPSRLSVVTSDGILQAVTSSSSENLAIRPGAVYTATGKATFQLPAGTYKIYAGRGFEYGIDSVEVMLKRGDNIRKTLRIRREVSTEGWISCDTHIHTSTHSHHGDATIEERAITIAGEGIEFPIMTDHNIYVDITPAAKSTNVLQYFTPVVGDELTTKVGHFNIFRTKPGTPVIEHNVNNWGDVMKNIGNDNTQAVILNHARDIHFGFRPFDPTRHLSSSGTASDDWVCPANAMELINSGSQQTHIMNLYYDWFGMLNRGYHLTPVGSSDSHDVNRYIVGQGRTYIQTNDTDVSAIDVDHAIRNFRAGKVMVSSGLLTKIVVNQKYGPGDLAPSAPKLSVTIEVHGPAWTKADRVSLYANGVKIKEKKIDGNGAGRKWKETWDFSMPKHDIYLVAIAEGPGDRMPYWPIAKPYQPSTPDWTPRLIGSTGAVWIDGDHNGKPDAAYDYAQTIMMSSGGDVNKIFRQLKNYNEAVAIQVAVLLWKEKKLHLPEVQKALAKAKKETKVGFERTIGEIKVLKDTH